MIPFSPPRIDDAVINEVTEVLKSGWITTGPRTKLFEKEISAYCGCKTTVAVNSWTMGMQVFLDFWGIGPGDEVILPAYTYCASANVIIHSGAKPVLVDVAEGSFNISVEEVRKAITPRTKAIMAVDIGGYPADYYSILDLVNEDEIRGMYNGNNSMQRQLGRILVISDAAHSFGAILKGKRMGSIADITAFSFHAVKNLTTAEGGAICFNLPEGFDHDEIYAEMCVKILHGQNKDALAKTQKGNWRYDVVEPGFKCNMTDIQAAIGLIELKRYQENLDRRKVIFDRYSDAFSRESWAIIPEYESADKISSYHLYLLRIEGATENMRDQIIQEIFDQDVSVNVHFQPLPILTAYAKRGYEMGDYPHAYQQYANEISLPVYFNLTDEQVDTVIEAVKNAVAKVLG